VLLLLLAACLSACAKPSLAPVTSREKAPPSTDQQGYYRIKAGDTLYSIAWNAGLDYREVAVWNGIKPPYTIYPGQRLRLKASPPARRTRFGATARVPNQHSQPPAKPAKPTGGSRAKVPAVAVVTKSQGAGASKGVKSEVAASSAGSGGGGWQWPTEGAVAQGFSTRDATRKGLEIAGVFGQPVRAAAAGKIVYSGSGLIGYGRLIIIKHNKNYLSAYGHNRKILVKEGDQVTKGEQIAEMGRPPDGGPRLHFEIRRDGKPVDPEALLPKRR